MLTKWERYEIAMKHAVKFAGKSEARPILKGAYHSPDGSLIVTDSHRLVVIEEGHSAPEPVVLDVKTKAPIHGNYPDTSRVIPVEWRTTVTVCSSAAMLKEVIGEWIQANKVAELMKDKHGPIAYMAIRSDRFLMGAKNDRSEYQHELPAVIDQDSLGDTPVYYNASYMIDALNLIKDFKPNHVQIVFNNPLSPFALKTDNGVTALLLPVKR